MGSTRYGAEGAVGRGLSPDIWQAYGFIGGDFGDPSRIPFFFDDFANVPLFTTNTTNILANGYRTLQSNGVTIQNCAAADNSEGEFGILEIAGNDAEDDEGYIEMGAGKNGLVILDDTVGERAVVAFEARIKRTSVTDAHTGFTFGIGAPAIATTGGMVAETHVLVAKDFVGFQAKAGSNDEIDAIYSIVTTGVAAGFTDGDNVATSVADTWMKLGCVFDPLAEPNNKMKYFVDGVELGASKQVTDAIITAASAFPTDKEMTLVLLTRNETQDTTAHEVYMDWWAVGSYAVDT